jgi:N-acetyl-1-D-myo-inositol-2-amino-2-deoxy-alpha-D-glucopyranoside deacetylase
LSTDHRLLMIFAHPDDESFGFAGTMLALADAGVKMSLIVATRGEEGEILVPGLATKENLGEVREGELRAAMEIVGIDDIHFLGFRDSGMAGTPPNHDPRAFVNQDVNKVAATIADSIAELRPTIILTYGPDGIYAHPDHIMVNTVAWPAVLKAGEDGRWKTPNLYFSAAPKERMRRMAELPNGPFASMDPDLVASLGMPASEITTWIDTTPFADRKREMLMAHRTQVGEEGPFNQLPPEMRRIWFSVETMRTIPLPWNPDPDDVIAELLPAAAHDHPFRV